jgi:hypothetical protein
MDYAYRPRTTAIAVTGAAVVIMLTAVILAVATAVLRHRFGISPALLLRTLSATAAQFDPRLAACPLIVVGGD